MQWASLLLLHTRERERERERERDRERGGRLLSQSAAALPAHIGRGIDLDSLIANQWGLSTEQPTEQKGLSRAQWRKSIFIYISLFSMINMWSAQFTLQPDSPAPHRVARAPHIEQYTRHTMGAFYKTKRAALFPFVIITPSVLFFSFPWTCPPFHRDSWWKFNEARDCRSSAWGHESRIF